ncbi:uncharacterized protein C5L36_0C08080 [Pichia kudriavzevii]|uniref:U3 small nucleolar ribonucleoprotein protein MPP10 n=1 Tax=Pichia kudriavzevii TaxID=4909 RepID=A0A2U9R6B6_PICKU|nr:uncharacterized protein C5L36_0C08080 [Pichia kudriavzevii]AWU76894.1 hypothetical protein C5L36_0C08080 [Pichia kudriavzevii]
MGFTLEELLNDPSILFTEKKNQADDAFNYENLLITLKDIVDPVIKHSENSVLDEIYVDGLDATQVWGQAKMVFDSVERSVYEEIEEYKENGLYLDEGLAAEKEEEEDGLDNEDSDVAFGERGSVDEEDSEEEVADEEEGEGEDESNAEVLPEEEMRDSDEGEQDYEEGSEEEAVQGGDAEEDKKEDGFGLNDGMFDLKEYQRQVLALEDGVEDQSDDEEVDYFGDLGDEDDDDEEMLTYKDFFDDTKTPQRKGKKSRKNKEATQAEEELGEDEYDEAFNAAQADIFDEEIKEEEAEKTKSRSKPEERLSTFEKQQREIQRQISELEAESIAEKKWTMKGEVSGKQRDADTLLEEELEFDRTAKPIPVITQETTETIEEIIKRRIVNQEFDEIPKRIISEMNSFKPSKKVQVSEEKSSKSLAELYEDEYAGKTGDEEINEELQKAHDEISAMFKDVTYQLDSLYSSHFVPKPKEKLLDVRVETSTIAMEDAQPLTMASNNTLAPQEVYKATTKVGKNEVLLKSGVVMAKGELETEDKQRLHRAKKRKQHMQHKDDSLKKKKVEVKQL